VQNHGLSGETAEPIAPTVKLAIQPSCVQAHERVAPGACGVNGTARGFGSPHQPGVVASVWAATYNRINRNRMREEKCPSVVRSS
jgi:hypothetical protein